PSGATSAARSAFAGLGFLAPPAGPVAAVLLPAAGAHVLLSTPDGRLRTPARRAVAGTMDAGAIATAVTMGRDLNAAVVTVAVAVAVVVGGLGFAERFGRVGPDEQRHMK